MSWAAVAVGAGTAIAGGIKTISANKRAKRADAESKRLAASRQPFRTPKEIMDLVGMSQNEAQTGFSPLTLDYLTGQNNRITASTLGTAKALGADVNQLSNVLDQSFQNIFRIGNENEMLKLKKFDSLFNSINILGNSKTAEWASADNRIKDQLQFQQLVGAAAQQDKQSGENLIINGALTAAQPGLYASMQPKQQNQSFTLDYSPTPVTSSYLSDLTPGANINAPKNIIGRTKPPGT